MYELCLLVFREDVVLVKIYIRLCEGEYICDLYYDKTTNQQAFIFIWSEDAVDDGICIAQSHKRKIRNKRGVVNLVMETLLNLLPDEPDSMHLYFINPMDELSGHLLACGEGNDIEYMEGELRAGCSILEILDENKRCQ